MVTIRGKFFTYYKEIKTNGNPYALAQGIKNKINTRLYKVRVILT